MSVKQQHNSSQGSLNQVCKILNNNGRTVVSGEDTSDIAGESDCDSAIPVLKSNSSNINNNIVPLVDKQSLTPYEQNAYYKKSRRTNSVDRVAEIHNKELKERNQQPDRP
jgi:predicted RNase H-like nuclease (RuvC/YqgF family)